MRTRPAFRPLFAAVLSVALSTLLVGSQTQTPPSSQKKSAPKQTQKAVNPRAQTIADFKKRVDNYMTLHKKLEASLPKLAKDAKPEEIDRDQRALAALVAAERKDAKPGDIFTRSMQTSIRSILARLFAHADRRKLLDSIRDEKTDAVKLVVNGRYPDNVPLSTMPPEDTRGATSTSRRARIPVRRRQPHSPRRSRAHRRGLHGGSAAGVTMRRRPDRVQRLCAAIACTVAVLCLSARSLGQAQTGKGVAVADQKAGTPPTALPNRADSLKFLVFGDFGTGDKPQYELAQRMVDLYKTFPFQMVALVGDNLYRLRASARLQEEVRGSLQTAPRRRREVLRVAREPRRARAAVLSSSSTWTASSTTVQGAETGCEVHRAGKQLPRPRADQVARGRAEVVEGSVEDRVLHHPLYSSGTTHGSDLKLRETLEPLFVQSNVSVVFNGHDHIYERTKPQQGIQYFVVGSGGQLREGGSQKGLPFSAKIVDDVQVFLAAEIYQNEMVFNAISRTGKIVDSGIVLRRAVKSPPLPRAPSLSPSASASPSTSSYLLPLPSHPSR